MDIIWTVLIGFVAGLLARFLMPGRVGPQGFVLTALLGVAGAFVATFLGQALGFYAPGEQTGFIGSIIGAIVILFVWGIFAKSRQAPPPAA